MGNCFVACGLAGAAKGRGVTPDCELLLVPLPSAGLSTPWGFLHVQVSTGRCR